MLEVTQVFLESNHWLCKILLFLKHLCLFIPQEDELKKAILVVFANKQVIALVIMLLASYVWIHINYIHHLLACNPPT